MPFCGYWGGENKVITMHGVALNIGVRKTWYGWGDILQCKDKGKKLMPSLWGGETKASLKYGVT